MKNISLGVATFLMLLAPACDDGTSATIADGAPGATGAQGGSCTVAQQDGGAKITCDDGTTATVANGAPGPAGPGVDPAQLQSLCVAADLRGDTYRPTFCEPRCTCGGDDLVLDDARCEEVAPGTFQVLVDVVTPGVNNSCISTEPCETAADCSPFPGIPQDEQDLSCTNGTCCRALLEFGLFGCSPRVCIASSGLPCTLPGESCGLSGEICVVEPDTSTLRCGLPCEGDADCPDAPPSVETVEAARYSGISSSDPAQPVTCRLTSPSGITTETINREDALKCIEEIEAELGTACTRL